MTHILKLLNTPAGYDVFLVQRGGRETPAAVGAQIIGPDDKFRFKRQPQFIGSAEISFEIDGVRQPAEETGNADLREDTVEHTGVTPPYRLVTNAQRFPKK